MGVVELLLTVVFALALGTGVTVTTSATDIGEFWFARICYIIAAIALVAAYLVWLRKSRTRPISSFILEFVLGALVASISIGGTIAAFQWIAARQNTIHEVSSSHPNFPYLRALINEDRTIKERPLFVENAKSVPIQGVEIVFQDGDDPSIRHLFRATILYQNGTWFVPLGEAHTLRVGAGQHVATISSLDGEFTEYLSLRIDNGTLKQKIEVYKSLPRGQGGLEPLLLNEEE